MHTFRIAFTGDFLDERGTSAYGDLRLDELQRARTSHVRFLTRQSPPANDAGYWQRFYSLEVTADDLARRRRAWSCLRPWVRRDALAAAA